jgi:hypothetical protein
MSLLGELLGYDTWGGDLMSVNRDSKFNCVVCGLSVFHHSPEATGRCMGELYRLPPEPQLAANVAKMDTEVEG